MSITQILDINIQFMDIEDSFVNNKEHMEYTNADSLSIIANSKSTNRLSLSNILPIKARNPLFALETSQSAAVIQSSLILI